MKKYVGNMKEYVGNMKKYVENLWDLEKFRTLLHLQIRPVGEAPSEARFEVSLFQLSNSYRLWDKETFQALPLFIGSGSKENFERSLSI